jgi:hypothetical protein
VFAASAMPVLRQLRVTESCKIHKRRLYNSPVAGPSHLESTSDALFQLATAVFHSASVLYITSPGVSGLKERLGVAVEQGRRRKRPRTRRLSVQRSSGTSLLLLFPSREAVCRADAADCGFELTPAVLLFVSAVVVVNVGLSLEIPSLTLS